MVRARNKNNEHGDFSSNIALKLSGKLKRSPMVVAEEIINSIHVSDELERTEFVKPGFINFYLQLKKHGVLKKSQARKAFGSSCVSEKEDSFRVCLSKSNWSAPCRYGHAAFGDSLARLLRKSGMRFLQNTISMMQEGK